MDAKKIVIFSTLNRCVNELDKENISLFTSKEKGKNLHSINIAHADYTIFTGHKYKKLFIDNNIISPFDQFTIYNGWMHINIKEQNSTLAILDPDTVNNNDLLITRTTIKSKNYDVSSYSLKNNSNHKWYSLKKPSLNKMLIFKQFDSSAFKNSNNKDNLVFHSSVKYNKNKPDFRDSLEIRFVVVKDNKEKSIENYWNADIYQKSSQEQYKMLKDIILNIDIKEKSSILDIGCGTGNAVNIMNKINSNANILGIDSSVDMILFSNKKYKENNKLSFKHIDISQLNNNEYSKKFDLVTTFNVLDWIPNLNLALKNIYNSMMINSDFTGIYFLENKKIFNIIEKTFKSDSWKAYFSNYKQHVYKHNSDKLLTEMKNIGFKKIQVKEMQVTSDFSEYSNFKKCFESWVFILNYLPKDKHDIFIKDVYNQIKNKKKVVGTCIFFKAIKT